MERLARAGYRAIGAEELLACASGQRATGVREIVITFDDAYRGLRDHAFPVLYGMGWPALCFVITDYAGSLNRWDVAYGGRRFAHLSWRDMRRWEARGMAFGSHSAAHSRLTWLPLDTLRRDLDRSRIALAEALDAPLGVVSYPFGAAGARERSAAREAGFAAGLTLASRWRGESMAIPRLPVYSWSPRTPGAGVMSKLEWGAALAANRCAVGTSLLLGSSRAGRLDEVLGYDGHE
jgi:peptidoglycan/xylan/chitin deacetylase (PgdA/CDA1 family)